MKALIKDGFSWKVGKFYLVPFIWEKWNFQFVQFKSNLIMLMLGFFTWTRCLHGLILNSKNRIQLMARKIKTFLSNETFQMNVKLKYVELSCWTWKTYSFAIRLNKIDWCEICCHSKLPTWVKIVWTSWFADQNWRSLIQKSAWSISTEIICLHSLCLPKKFQ